MSADFWILLLCWQHRPQGERLRHIWGGVAVECRLKAFILIYHNISEWDEESKRPKDPRYKQPIPRTNHGLIGAVKLMQDVFSKAKADYLFLEHLNNVTYPTGPTEIDFIALRYSAQDLDGGSLVQWQKSLNYVLGWLKKNEVVK